MSKTRTVFSSISSFLNWLFSWYASKSKAGWQQELARVRNGKTMLFGEKVDPSIYIIVCIAMGLLLFPYLATEAFSNSVITGLSFIWTAFLAFSFAYILRNPLLLILVFVGVIFGGEVTSLLFSAGASALAGDIIGAIILLGVGIYLITWVNSIKTGEILLKSNKRKPLY